uniref:C2HC/C3H-type domain-containing protein n=1 Tax=Falco tinnunculus TaxID=100819 RepID=A0A8C4V2Y5_FALTI
MATPKLVPRSQLAYQNNFQHKFLSDKEEKCSFCGRRFVLRRLEKHMSICSKVQHSKRKVFDSSKARARGTDLEHCSDCLSLLQKQPPRRNNWRQKHDYLMRTLQQARQVQQIVSKGGKAPAPPSLPPIENSDYVACPYCTRRFSPRAAERHIPKCKTIKNRPPPPPRRKRRAGPNKASVFCLLCSSVGAVFNPGHANSNGGSG